MTDLKDTKEGDKLIISHGLHPSEIITVNRTTKTQVICGTRIFNRHGDLRGAGRWGCIHAHPATEAEIAEVRAENRRHNCMSVILHTTRSELDKLPTERLMQIAELMKCPEQITST